VGQDEHALSAVRSANIGRSKRNPLRIEPAFGKFSEYGVSCGKSENWRDVFKKHPLASNLANDSHGFVEESASGSAFKARLLSCDRQIRAGETENCSSHSATIESCWEGSNVTPDRCRIQGDVFHARRQDANRRKFDLHIAAATSLWSNESDGKVESADAAEETGIGRYIHIHSGLVPSR
jgi:hypothetical protein